MCVFDCVCAFTDNLQKEDTLHTALLLHVIALLGGHGFTDGMT